MENVHALPPSTELKGRYIIEQVLGQGGFGITYKAKDSVLGKIVCIKELFVSGNSTRSENEEVMTVTTATFSLDDFKRKFIDEAQQLARFNHPNIVSVLDIFEANNTVYMVMEFVHGQTLQKEIQTNGALTPLEAIPYMQQLLDAVAEVHSKDMLHRDIKPENILVDDKGRVVLIDFGSAREFSEGKVSTQTSMLTPGFAPMEQYSTRAKRGVFTDIYAIGATFYYMLTGSKPLSAADRMTEELVPPHQLNAAVSSQVSSAIMLAMEMKPEDRFQSVTDFRMALHDLWNETLQSRGGSGSKTRIMPPTSPTTQLPPQQQKKKRGRILLPVIALLVVVVAGILFAGNLTDSEESATPDTPGEVAIAFLTAVDSMKFEEAKQYATPESASMLDMLANLSDLADDSTEVGTGIFSVVDEQISGDSATVTYTSDTRDGEGVEETLQLVLLDDAWKVRFDKGSFADDLLEEEEEEVVADTSETEISTPSVPAQTPNNQQNTRNDMQPVRREPTSFTLYIRNDAYSDIYFLYITEAGDPEWGEDWLGSSTLDMDDYKAFTVPYRNVDIKVEFENDQVLEIYDMRLPNANSANWLKVYGPSSYDID